MKTFKEFMYENTEFKNVDEVVQFIKTLNIPKRKPSNIKKVEHISILGLVNMVNDYEKTNEDFYKKLIMDRINVIRLSKQEIENIYKGAKSNIIKKDIATYIKYNSSSYNKFLDNVEIIESFLKGLKGYHKKALKNLKIKFVGSGDIKSIAKYDTNNDELLINTKRTGNTKEEYGSLLYVVLHELGHRYLKFYPQKWDYNGQEWVTTKYSNVDSFTGEEKFAELFALSNWKNKYKEYSDKIKSFEQMI